MAKQHLWHPFTPMQEWAKEPKLVVDRAEGNYLIDPSGKRYLDGVSSLWTNVHGHNHPRINAAIEAQLHRVAHSTLLGLSNEPAEELAARLAAHAPGALDHVFYSDSGSTAVEIALKQAFQYWQNIGRPQKTRFVHLEQAYHGDTLGAVAVGGIDLFHQVFGPLLVETLSTPTPHPFRTGRSPEDLKQHCLQALDALLQKHAGSTAAVIVEPLVQGAAGILVHPPGFLRGVAELAQKHDVLLIVDEVATGFGRTGTLFACEQEGVAPDLLCLAKGISGGYLPLAATLSTSRIYEAFLAPRHEARTFFHGHTYTGNPLACAAGLANLDIFATEAVVAGLAAKIEHLAQSLRRLAAEEPRIGDVRQRGLMVGLELVQDESLRPFPSEQAIGHRVCLAAREKGVILRNLGDVVVLMPPLSITLEQVDQLVAAVRHGLRVVLR